MIRKFRSQTPVSSNPLNTQTVLSILRIGQNIGLLLPSESTPDQTFWHTQIIDLTVQFDMVVTPAPPPELLPSGSHALEASVVFRPEPHASFLRGNFATTILNRLPSPSNPLVDALLLRAPAMVQRANLREFYRVAIPSILELGTRLVNGDGPLQELATTLVDLSAGGALLSLHGQASDSWDLQVGDPIDLELDCRAVVASLAVRLTKNQQAIFTIPSQVVRVTLGPSREWCHVAMQFKSLAPAQEELLHTLVLKLQQWLASRHQSWGETGWMTTLRARQTSSQG